MRIVSSPGFLLVLTVLVTADATDAQERAQQRAQESAVPDARGRTVVWQPRDGDNPLTTFGTFSGHVDVAVDVALYPDGLGFEEAASYAEEALRIAKENPGRNDATYRATLNQTVNVWRESEVMARLTLDPRVAVAATALAGKPLKLWHDHVLAKDPRNGARTEWHQDQPYWPHGNSTEPISCWLALVDVPETKGCMSFMPGQHHRTDLPMQVLSDPRSLFTKDPELEYAPKVTVPLKAGDCTFHHGRTPHMANANDTDDYRLAHVVIYIDRETTYRPAREGEGHARSHCVTAPLDLQPGEVLAGELFPEV